MTLLLTFLLACGGGPTAATPDTPIAPEPLAGKVCAACGMVVPEQPSPRGQVRHRDGTHAHFCSLGDLRAYLQAPSPHGKAIATWVEDLPADHDPTVAATAPLPWVEAQAARYVVGFERPGTMGRPALSFTDATAAEAAAAKVGGHVVGWDALVATPYAEDPPKP